MISNYTLLTELLERTVNISRKCIEFIDAGNFEQVNSLIDHRDKLISIIQTINERLELEQKANSHDNTIEFNNQANQLIGKIQEMDDYILTKLTEERDKTQIEIAKAFKNKENFKGYNLNSLK